MVCPIGGDVSSKTFLRSLPSVVALGYLRHLLDLCHLSCVLFDSSRALCFPDNWNLLNLPWKTESLKKNRAEFVIFVR